VPVFHRAFGPSQFEEGLLDAVTLTNEQGLIGSGAPITAIWWHSKPRP
jgi:hypothetical protein